QVQITGAKGCEEKVRYERNPVTVITAREPSDPTAGEPQGDKHGPGTHEEKGIPPDRCPQRLVVDSVCDEVQEHRNPPIRADTEDGMSGRLARSLSRDQATPRQSLPGLCFASNSSFRTRPLRTKRMFGWGFAGPVTMTLTLVSFSCHSRS